MSAGRGPSRSRTTAPATAATTATFIIPPTTSTAIRPRQHRLQFTPNRTRAARRLRQYLTIEPPARLSFTWISAHTERRPTVVTVELFERGPDTELVLTHRRLPPGQVESHRKGWTDIAAKLATVLEPG
jgi:uncharacterized protein YndB with AHSA1/START domain